MAIVRLGIRAQLLLSLAALLAVGLLPLVFAVTSVARASLMQSWQVSARELGRAVAGHVAEARVQRSGAELDALLDAQLGHGVGAIAIYDVHGTIERHAGEAGTAAALPRQVVSDKEQVQEVTTARGPAMVVLIPATHGPVGVLLHTDPSAVRVAPLIRLVALYGGLLGLGLLVLSYMVMTRLVVTPIDHLSRAARRVADGDRQLPAPPTGGRELVDLGTSLAEMTARLLAEEEALRQKVDELEAATDELRRTQDTLVRSERLASVGRLAAGLAHEIGNPITAVLGLLQLLLDGGLEPAEQQDFLERIQRETERVNRVMRDLLTFARPAVGPSTDAEEDASSATSIGDAVAHVVALVRPQKSFAEVEIITQLEEDLPAVAMQAPRLEQVLLNLVLNAADATGGSKGQITIEAKSLPQAVAIIVEDDGGGIEPQVQDRLFEPFVTTKEPGKGTGLGLAVCRGLLEGAGGSIDVDDGARGARFVVELPAASPQR